MVEEIKQLSPLDNKTGFARHGDSAGQRDRAKLRRVK